MKNNILEFLRGDGNFTTNKKLVKKIGLINATIIQEIISYSFYAKKQGYYIEDDFFLYTKKNLQETFGISRRDCENAFIFMNENKLIIEIKKGMPQRTYIKLNENIIDILCNLMSDNEQTVVSEVPISNVSNDTNNVRNDIIECKNLHSYNNNTINNTINNNINKHDIQFFINDCLNFGFDYKKIIVGLDSEDVLINYHAAINHYKRYDCAKVAQWLKNTNRNISKTANSQKPVSLPQKYHSKVNEVDCGF